ncbi:MAG: hypothetical protein ACXADY_08605 [Candidatus Hodarchaeales archaeon]|jgi:hypothetical protein
MLEEYWEEKGMPFSEEENEYKEIAEMLQLYKQELKKIIPFIDYREVKKSRRKIIKTECEVMIERIQRYNQELKNEL